MHLAKIIMTSPVLSLTNTKIIILTFIMIFSALNIEIDRVDRHAIKLTLYLVSPKIAAKETDEHISV